MIEDLDIYRTAKIYIDQYGEAALLRAIQHQENFSAAEDKCGAALWGQIADAIRLMQIPFTEEMITCH